jgi:hypothetical protein
MLLGAVTLGQQTRIEGRCIRAALAGAEALARAEDRYRVLNAESVAAPPRASSTELVQQATEQRSPLGDVVIRREAPWIFDLVVYDLDAPRVVYEPDVVLALNNLMDLLCRLQLLEVAMEPIGVAHGGIAPEHFARALLSTCARGPIGLKVLICEPERRILTRIITALES